MQYPVALQLHNLISAPSSPEPNTLVSESTAKVIKITNCRVLRDGKIVDKDDIWIQEGKIIDPHKFFWYQKRLPDEVLDAEGLLVSPGFIEAQINGAFGVDFSLPSDQETYERGLTKVSRGLLKYGTTSYCPTIVSSSAAVYHQVLPLLKPRPGSSESGASILGAHVEGPFINEARVGAHERRVLQASANSGYQDFKNVYGFEGGTPEEQRQLSDRDLHSVKIITCAPELEGVMESIPDLVKAGITVSVGHSMANTSEAEKAVLQGATFITHLFNAMPQFHHRDPGVIGLLGSRLNMPRPYYGLICDGIHVHPNSVKIAYDSHPEGVILVTDAMSAMGLSPGNYRLGNMNVTKEADRVVVEDTNILAGSQSSVSIASHQHPQLNMTKETKRQQNIRTEQHPDFTAFISNEGFLPTPPGSASLSPQKMMTSCIPSTLDQLPQPSSLDLLFNGTTCSTVWSTSIMHSDVYEEHDVYDECEHFEGSGHSLRIISLSVSDTDDNGDIYEEIPLHDAAEPVECADKSLRKHSFHQLQQSISTFGQQDTSPLTNSAQQAMSECSCHPTQPSSSSGGTAGDSNSVSIQRTSSSVFTDVNNDGDLCCPSSSVITLDACMRNFIQFTSCSLIEALEAVTLHPAVLLGIQDRKGVIKPGADADLVFLSDDLHVKRVFVAGQEVDLSAIRH
ncbi:putative N-acetylglucosamine-6-phosphate deacetylase [Linnemannia zychae]|nr:putative N-acetylglucosamine-6-phosphate deacetylase [Linnemannia zychae]